MSDILKDLRRMMDNLPKSPFNGQIVLIPAQRIEREVEVFSLDENGAEVKTVKKVSSYIPLPEYRHIHEECKRNGVDYQLSEHAPTKDKDGNLCVMVMPKPKPNLSFVGDGIFWK